VPVPRSNDAEGADSTPANIGANQFDQVRPNETWPRTPQPELVAPSVDAEGVVGTPAFMVTNQFDEVRPLPEPAPDAGTPNTINRWIDSPIQRAQRNASTNIGSQSPTSILPTPAVAAGPMGPAEKVAPASSWVIGESNPTPESIRQLQVTLNQRFPGRGIELERVAGSLVVRGSAAGQREAIEIVSSVRDNYLVPVVDRLDVPRGRP
jgi:hypothetical protein